MTSSTAQKRHYLQSERLAQLLIDVLYHYRAERGVLLHAFCVLPNHIHILISLDETVSVERAMQLIKGGFSFRAAKELGMQHEIWQRGFSEVRILDHASFVAHRRYIHDNPVKAGLADEACAYPFSSAAPGWELDEEPQGLKPKVFVKAVGTTEVVP